MAYTPTTWNTGDTITASALNKMEQGIAEGGGGGGDSVFYEVTTTSFPSGNNSMGWFNYVKKSGSTYSFPSVLASFLGEIVVNGNRTACWFASAPVPSLENYYLVFLPNSGVTITASSGGIASTPITVNGATAYIVTGNFSFTLQGWA